MGCPRDRRQTGETDWWLFEQIAVSVFPPSNAPDNFVQ
jgi:hypothetical protein